MEEETHRDTGYVLDEKGVVFIGDDGRPYWLTINEGTKLILYWHPEKRWVILRKAEEADVIKAIERRLPEDRADLYHQKANRKI